MNDQNFRQMLEKIIEISKAKVWNLGNVLLTLLLFILLPSITVMIIVFYPQIAFSKESKKQSVSLIQSGTSFTSNGGGELTPIWSIMIGNTEKAEQLTNTWSPHFGPHALDGTIWVRSTDNQLDIWKRVIFHRPKNIYETLVFFENPGNWTFTEIDSFHILSSFPWHKFTSDQLNKVDFIVTYFTGDTKIYLKNDISIEEAKELFEWVIDILR